MRITNGCGENHWTPHLSTTVFWDILFNAAVMFKAVPKLSKFFIMVGVSALKVVYKICVYVPVYRVRWVDDKYFC